MNDSKKFIDRGRRARRRQPRGGFYILAVCLLCAVGCQEQRGPQSQELSTRQIRVAAASDLQFVLPEVISAFERIVPGITVVPTFGSSGSFFAQIEQQAPFDLFLSADMDYCEKLAQGGFARQETLKQYALGRLVVWARTDSTLNVAKRGVEALSDPAVRTIAIANPKTAPYGRAAIAAFQSLRIEKAITPKLVLGDNVAQAAQFVESGAADLGVIAMSIALSPNLKDRGTFKLVPAELHPPIMQGGIVLTRAPALEDAQAFLDFLTGSAGQALLTQHGFPSDAE